MTFFEGFKRQNVFIMFSFFMKHSYQLAAKITPDVNKSNFYMVLKSYCRWLSACLMELLVSDYMVWTKLLWCVYGTKFFWKFIFTRNINHCYFNFLYELPSFKMFLVCSYLLPIFNLVTLEMFLLKRVWESNEIY